MTSDGDVLTAEMIAHLVHLADGRGVHAVVVVGSAARGDATQWSDIDVHAYVEDPAEGWETRPVFVDERLVMIASDTIAASRAELTSPERAIWAVPALRDMRILFERDARVRTLKDEAEAFDWAILRLKAERLECQRMAMSAEFVYKIRAAIERKDEPAALHAAGALVGRCARGIVIARGTFIRTENEYYRRAREAAGPVWAALHRECFGLGPDGPIAMDARAQGMAACRLYAETAVVLDDILDGATRGLVRRALAVIS